MSIFNKFPRGSSGADLIVAPILSRDWCQVTELCTGGELFDRIIEKTESEEGRYSERDAARLVSKILSAIAYCHDEHNICHR